MKILIVGDFLSQIYESAFFDAFLKSGHNVFKFSTGDYFKNKSFFCRLQNKFLFGPIGWKINRDLISCVEMKKPDLIFIYRGSLIFADTIKKIKKTGAMVFGYNNDDPFSEKYSFYIWRHWLKAVPCYDHIFVYRQKNLDDYKKIGYKKTSFLRAYYVKEKNFPIEKLPTNKYVCDVIFAGHWENDGRDEYIKAIIDAGINLKLYGPEWQRSKYYNFFKNKLGYEIKSLKDDYNLALNSAKIALVFLSKLNNDTYTRRNFEIPVVKTFMLSEYGDDLNNLFAAGREADYFHNKEEMIEKINYYLANENKRKEIVEAGYRRLIKDSHEVANRINEIISIFNKYKNELR